MEPVTANAELEIAPSSIMPLGYEDEAAYVSAPVKRQPINSDWCWAACMASIVQLETGTNYSCSTMARRYTSDYDRRATLDEAIDWLSNDFGIDYSKELDGTYLTGILNTLAHGHAVFGGFTNGLGGHASIIRGIDCGGKTFSVMDPLENGTNYLSGNIQFKDGNYGSLVYVQTVTGITLTLNEYSYCYE